MHEQQVRDERVQAHRRAKRRVAKHLSGKFRCPHSRRLVQKPDENEEDVKGVETPESSQDELECVFDTRKTRPVRMSENEPAQDKKEVHDHIAVPQKSPIVNMTVRMKMIRGDEQGADPAPAIQDRKPGLALRSQGSHLNW